MGCCSSSADDVYEDNVVVADKPSVESNPVSVLQQEGTVNPVEAVVKPAPVRTEKVNPNANRVCFGAGCYWGTEKFFKYHFVKRNRRGRIIDGLVGFMGPTDAPDNPTYKEVCSGYTGHVEVYEMQFSGGLSYFEDLVRFFFQFHDPTTKKRQGNDVGTQYTSVVYCYTQAQFDIATRVRNELQQLLDEGKLNCYENKTVHTDVRMATKFYPAHKEHQDYLTNNPNGYCNHSIRFKEWPAVSLPAAASSNTPLQ